MKKWVISDTHFNHENMRNGKLKGTKRPWEYQQTTIDNWNSLVAPDDLVYHLGDVIFARKEELANIMNSLNGFKILIRGNHDYYDTGNSRRKVNGVEDFYTNNGFLFVAEAIMERNFVLLSHAPMKLTRDIRMNIHGHFHDNDHRSIEPWYQEMYKKDNRYRLFSLELEGYKPVLLDEFVGRG